MVRFNLKRCDGNVDDLLIMMTSYVVSKDWVTSVMPYSGLLQDTIEQLGDEALSEIHVTDDDVTIFHSSPFRWAILPCSLMLQSHGVH